MSTETTGPNTILEEMFNSLALRQILSSRDQQKALNAIDDLVRRVNRAVEYAEKKDVDILELREKLNTSNAEVNRLTLEIERVTVAYPLAAYPLIGDGIKHAESAD